MKSLKYILAAVLLLGAATVNAQEDSWTKYGPTNTQTNAGFIVRAGYTFGGTAPMPVPAEIRSINEFSPKGGFNIGLDCYKMLSKRWGISAGWHFFYEGFHTSADVKGYKMELVQEGNVMAGYFTGCDVTNTDAWGMKIPVLATFRISPRWNVSLGPYFTTYFKTSFDGEVYEGKNGQGYLRVDDPTGQKVIIDRTNPATYDFKDNMRRWNAGLELQFDWKAMKHMNVFAQLDWGLANTFEPDFKAVAFKMYPIYATVGLAYRY